MSSRVSRLKIEEKTSVASFAHCNEIRVSTNKNVNKKKYRNAYAQRHEDGCNEAAHPQHANNGDDAHTQQGVNVGARDAYESE